MVLFALSIGWFVVIVDSSIINVALPGALLNHGARLSLLVGAAAYGCALLCALAVGSSSEKVMRVGTS